VSQKTKQTKSKLPDYSANALHRPSRTMRQIVAHRIESRVPNAAAPTTEINRSIAANATEFSS
jgi:hypothetical protein